MNTIKSFISRIYRTVATRIARTWSWYKSRSRNVRIIIGVLVAAVIVALFYFTHRSAPVDTASGTPTVELRSIGELSGTATGQSIIGTVRSVSQADILSQSGGTIRSINTKLGAYVPAGFVLAQIDNASEAAQVLQAQGAYESALAARNIALLQTTNSSNTFDEAKITAVTTYRTSYATIDTILANDVDAYFARVDTGVMLYNNGAMQSQLDAKALAIKSDLAAWNASLAHASESDPAALLDTGVRITQNISNFLSEISALANARNTSATPTQLANLATARTTVDGVLSTLSGARDAYRAKQTASQVANTQSYSSGTATASADATVKQALGALRAAQANYEKTVIRAPIGGTVNFFPIHIGDYVTAFTHVATVAQNGALEVVASVSEDSRQSISVGTHLKIEDSLDGVVTSVSPALDPVTKQIEIHIGVIKGDGLENGQAVHITLPTSTATAPTQATATSTTLLLPLTAVKLTPTARVLFSVGTDGRIVANPVTIGDVRGDRIEILTSLSPNLMIIADARGRSEGEKVLIATSSPL